jgi:hypothetical protein
LNSQVVGVIYDGTVHCSKCSSKRWSFTVDTRLINSRVVDRLLEMNDGVKDYEGNPPQPIYSSSPLMCVDKEFKPIYVRCIDCGNVIK